MCWWRQNLAVMPQLAGGHEPRNAGSFQELGKPASNFSPGTSRGNTAQHPGGDCSAPERHKNTFLQLLSLWSFVDGSSTKPRTKMLKGTSHCNLFFFLMSQVSLKKNVYTFSRHLKNLFPLSFLLQGETGPPQGSRAKVGSLKEVWSNSPNLTH